MALLDFPLADFHQAIGPLNSYYFVTLVISFSVMLVYMLSPDFLKKLIELLNPRMGFVRLSSAIAFAFLFFYVLNTLQAA